MSTFDDFTLSELRAFRVSLLSAMLSGTRSVTAGDRTILYKSNQEMKIVLDLLDEAIAGLDGIPRARRVVVRSRSGW